MRQVISADIVNPGEGYIEMHDETLVIGVEEQGGNGVRILVCGLPAISDLLTRLNLAVLNEATSKEGTRE